MNYTIIERIWCMLSHSKLPSSFQDETMRTIVDLINFSPSFILDSVVPKKMLIEKSFSYDHLKVCECRAFVYILKDKWSKFDSKSKEFIFLRYRYKQFRYRLWNLIKKLVKSKDIVLFENQTTKDMEKVDRPSCVSSYSPLVS